MKFKTTEKQRADARRRYYARKESGLCMYCNNPAEKGKIRCEIHKQIVSDYVAGIRDIRKLKGLCSSCGKRSPQNGRVNCENCLAKSRAGYKKKKEKL